MYKQIYKEMTNSMQVFNFNHSEVRTITNPQNEIYFVAVDVCNILDIENSRDAVARLDDDEIADVVLNDTSSNGVTQKRKFTIVNESGFYSLVFSSRKPEAKLFRKWVTNEVLPAIRKTGAYNIQKLHTTTYLSHNKQVKILEKVILDTITPAIFRKDTNAQLATATQILTDFPQFNVSRDLLGRTLKKLGFISKSYGQNYNKNAKMYCFLKNSSVQ